ncbi:MAG: hypothetical protein PUE36_03075 [Bacteroidales bacterium]|nr:hypothetical protein [Bacteroidales bacterium]
MTNENDTLTAKQHEENEAHAKRMKTKDAMIAKMLASMAGGMVAGAGVAYASNEYINDRNAEETTEETAGEAPAQENGKPTVEERLSELEEKERIRQQQETVRQQQEAERQRREAERQRHEAERVKREEEQQDVDKTVQKPDPKPEVKHENNFFDEHDVKIEQVETCQIPDGRKVNMYYGKVDGHDAAFVDDGNGKIVAAIVDENDNGDIEDKEEIDLRNSNISSQDMAQYRVQPVSQELEVKVVSVENNVNMDGETVDVATVEIEGTPAMLIDRNQDGEVNLAIADNNNNGILDEGDVVDVSSNHIPMPTRDDMDNTLLACGDDGTTDYSNDADTTVYEL